MPLPHALLREFALQSFAAAAVLGITAAIGADGWGVKVLSIGLVAFVLARLFCSPPWWQAIHLAFAPLLYWAHSWQMAADISPLWPLAAFLLIWLVFRSALTNRVPLYLSNARTAQQLAALLPENITLLDAGAGVGSLLLPLARLRPDLILRGIEHAPLPWLIGKIRVRRHGSLRLDWRFENFWTHSFAPYAAMYCFLSPAPMTQIWEKACREMKPGSLFISKAFPVSDIPCETLADEDSADVDTLYLYRIPASTPALR
ncbi:MAG: hypothetical protein LBQ75_08650 [Zoogloeaceae bacterium]|jgi:hypothetical protein|nr:hypothetical protein [Zoogloeaceae bacterium]